MNESALVIPFSRVCMAGAHDTCVHRRCGCFCHPEGYGPNIDESEGLMPPVKIPCPSPGCESSFFDLDLLKSHTDSLHPEFANPDYDPPLADVHPIREETPVRDDEPTIKCPSCDRSFKTQGWLDRHLASVHGEIDVPVRRRDPDEIAARQSGVVGGEEVDGLDKQEHQPYALHIEVGGGVYVELIAPSAMAFSMACEAAERWGVPFTTTQPE